MKVLLLGHEGRIGRRYLAILKYLKSVEVAHKDLSIITYDVLDPFEGEMPWRAWEFEKAIIATPTDTHVAICKEMIVLKREFLVEKPLSKNMSECKDVMNLALKNDVKGYVVNNWERAIVQVMLKWEPKSADKEKTGINKISYNYFNHGSDYMVWDCCQLIHLARKLKCALSFKTESPRFDVYINDSVNVSLRDIEDSYVEMITHFLNPNTYFRSKLWGLEEACDMTDAVHLYVANQVTEYGQR